MVSPALPVREVGALVRHAAAAQFGAAVLLEGRRRPVAPELVARADGHLPRAGLAPARVEFRRERQQPAEQRRRRRHRERGEPASSADFSATPRAARPVRPGARRSTGRARDARDLGAEAQFARGVGVRSRRAVRRRRSGRRRRRGAKRAPMQAHAAPACAGFGETAKPGAAARSAGRLRHVGGGGPSRRRRRETSRSPSASALCQSTLTPPG